MIRRYSVREINGIFSDSNRYGIWLKIELLVLKYLSLRGLIDPDDYARMEVEMVAVPTQIRDLERGCSHDVVAFINHISSTTGCPARKWVHYGLTSSDLVDTGNSAMLRQANAVLIRHLESLMSRLRRMAKVHRRTYCADRSRGFEIDGATSFGLLFAGCHRELRRTLEEFELHRRHVECASVSGSMGICSHAAAELQDFVAHGMGLYGADCSTQVLGRDRYYRYFDLLNRMVRAVHRLCVDLRLMVRTEVGEVSECFRRGQTGSSSMPHKRNPITLENICGLCRLFDSYCAATSKNISIWLERDISHSSVDRVVFMDGISIAIQIMRRLEGVLSGLRVHESAMAENIRRNQYPVFGRYIARALHRHHGGELSMEEIVRSLERMRRSGEEEGVLFRDVFRRSAWGSRTDDLFDLSTHLSFVDRAYDRLFGDEGQRASFESIFYREEEILNAVYALANTLNLRYRSSSDVVRFMAPRDEAVVFISRLLPRLNFPVELHTVNLMAEEAELAEGHTPTESSLDVYAEYVRGREVVLLGSLLRSEALVEFFRRRMESMGAAGTFVVALFASDRRSIDLYGLPLPNPEGVAGFGIGNSEGLFRNCCFVGRLKANCV